MSGLAIIYPGKCTVADRFRFIFLPANVIKHDPLADMS